ncbi:MAG: hypothetical protein E7543_05895 [Ruminococcaceae bacterium]|nr:hypothetical protein [Oscillospiraceae bacterium]
MIWIDFGIICIGQDRISAPSNVNDIVVEGYARTEDSEPFYNENYHFHTADKLLGCWYNVCLPDPIRCEDSFFDIAAKGVPYVQVVPKWSEYVKNILSFYIEQSPINKIAVLLRVQDLSNDTVNYECSLDEFIQGLSVGNIKWNELYFVH